MSNLSGADISGANLSGADLNAATVVEASFKGADLSRTDFSRADLSRTDFSRADLSKSHFNSTHLIEATFVEANLSGADFSAAHLNDVNLTGANLYSTNLALADLNGADLTKAKTTMTIFVGVDLSKVKGLVDVVHSGPSTIGIDTISHSQGNIPEVFLKGAGVDDTFITYIRSLVGKPIEYYSCFISYSNRDEAFAKRLYADLQNHNVRCWFASEHLKVGDKFRHRIDESIRVYDKLLLVLSEASLASTWVGYEVEKALDKEPERKPNVLFPIRLDKAILTCETDWAKDIRKSRHIGDFEHWKDHDAYQIAFKRLLRDLKAES